MPVTIPARRPSRTRLGTGVSLDVAETGDAAGPPVVLLHGITDSRRSWDPVLPELDPGIRAIAVSQRGHGDSERPASGYRTRDLADDVPALLDALHVERAVVVGHSMGSTVARRVAVDHPHRVQALVLVASFASYADKPEIGELASALDTFPPDRLDPGFVRAFQAGTFVRPVPPGLLETVVGESLKVPTRVFRAALAGNLEDDVSGDLGRIRCPTLVVWGDRDPYCPRRDQDAIVRAIPGARLSVYAGTAHCPHWEEPARFARDLGAVVAVVS